MFSLWNQRNDMRRKRSLIIISLLAGIALLIYGFVMVDVLEKAKSVLPDWQALVVTEKLGQAYGFMADTNSASAVEYRKKAVAEYQALIDAGYTRFYLYNNIAILYQEANDYASAESELNKMKSLFADDYRVYMQEAFLLADEESAKNNADRNYSSFASAYDTAERLYKTSLADGGADDAKMKMLENLYSEIKSNGWL